MQPSSSSTDTGSSGDTARRTAVVIGVGSLVGLQTARLLHRQGLRVVGVTADRRHPYARSRAVDRLVVADLDEAGLPACFADLARTEPGALLVPCTDLAVEVTAAHAVDVAPHLRTVLPPSATVRALGDKARLAELAAQTGLPVPATVVVRGPADVDRACTALTFPVVLKPAFKDARWKRGTSVKALRLSSPEQLRARVQELLPHTDALVVQSFVPGGDGRLSTCNAYVGADGRVLASFVTRKVRQWPPEVGIGSYGVEDHDPEVAALAARVLGCLPYRGLAYVEVKRDPAGALLLIEANVGRPTGRSATAEAGGVQLLGTMVADAFDLPLPAARAQTGTGAAWCDVRRDVLAATREVRAGRLRPSTWVRQLLAVRAHAVWSLRDPVPFAAEVVVSGLRAARRRAVPLTSRRRRTSSS